MEPDISLKVNHYKNEKLDNAMELIECIYCGFKKPPQEFSEEHILPQALGGNISDAIADNQICQQCNNNCGLFIDAPFLKSWFIKNAAASEAFCYADPLKIIALPLESSPKLVGIRQGSQVYIKRPSSQVTA